MAWSGLMVVGAGCNGDGSVAAAAAVASSEAGVSGAAGNATSLYYWD